MKVRTITFTALVAGLGLYGCNQIPETSSVTGTEISDLSLDSDIAAVSEDLSETTAILGLEGSLGGGQSENVRRGKKRRPSPLRGLDLSDEQKAALKELMQASHDQAKAAIEAARADGADKEAVGAIREGLKTELEAGLATILTADQLAAFQDAKAGASQRQNHTSPFAGLELTEDQQAAIHALRETSNEQMKAAIEAAKTDGADREAVKAILEAFRTDFEADLAAILTPDQLAAWQAARAQKEPRSRGTRGRRKGGHRTPAAPAEETAGNSEVN